MTKYLTDDELMAMVLPVLDEVPIGSRWSHRKGGDPYQVEVVGLSEGGQEPVVGYRAERLGAVLWFRVARDFLDGRFYRVHDGGVGVLAQDNPLVQVVGHATEPET